MSLRLKGDVRQRRILIFEQKSSSAGASVFQMPGVTFI